MALLLVKRIPALILAGAVAFVFLAPVAGAGMSGSRGGAGAVGHVTGHRVVKQRGPIGRKSAKPGKKVVTVGKLKPVPVKPPTLPAILPTVPVASPSVPSISVPGAVTSLPSSTDSNACVDTGTLCTAEQLCEIWGMNCPSVPLVAEPGPGWASEASTGADPAAGA